MIKDLVVNLTLDVAFDPVADFAISIARAFSAHIAAIAFTFDPIITPTVMDGLSATWIDTERDNNRLSAQAAIDRFEAVARRENLFAETRLLEGTLAGAATRFGKIARTFDLSVVGQMNPDRMAPDPLFVESAMFELGRPTIVVPHIHNAGLKLDRVLVCWDRSHYAARAIADAMPFLRRSKTVEIVMVGGPSEDEMPGADLAQHLARHGLNVDVSRIAAGDHDAANAILSHAADCGADLIVMGGYGHSRLREFVIGGDTRTMLDSMTVPVLMAH